MDKQFLDLEGLRAYKSKSETQYSAADPASDWYKKTREQLYELIGEFEKRSGKKYQLVYKEKPNAQAGPSKVVFKDYVLAGFAPQDVNLGMSIFIKLAVAHLGGNPFFGIDVDVNYKDPNNPYTTYRDEMQRLSAYSLPIDNNFPKSWSALVDKFYPSFVEAEKVYRSFISKVQEEKKAKNRMVWLYSPGEKAVMWDEFQLSGIIALPYDQFGDLSEYANKEEIANAVQEQSDDEVYQKNIILACYEFANHLNLGDIIIAKKGKRDYIGYGVVDSEYYFENNANSYKSRRKVVWKKKGKWFDKEGDIAVKTLTDITKYPKYVKRLAALLGIDELDLNNIEDKLAMNLNKILYGPPGTGKTYHSIDHAVRIASPTEYADNHLLNKVVFERLRKEGRIVFTTFHQSMSYEDFIEGIKPKSNDGKVTYEIEDGIFKAICENARKSTLGVSASKQDVLYEEFIEEMRQRFDKSSDKLIIKSSTNTDVRIISVDEQVIITKAATSDHTTHVNKERLLKADAAFNEMSDIQNVYRDLKPFAPGAHTYYWAVLNEFKRFKKNKNINTQNKQIENYVLIIDEINRGNIASIFGELITLIEDSKRKGNDEELEVTLPYSKEPFSVPSNLYIIGTMNTADRSVEALDTALRRRFVFTEMMPNYTLEDLNRNDLGLHLGNLLKTINDRIEVLKDRDHLIGHSYFMQIQDEKGLADAFNQKIIPLLKEYFYGDFGQIGLVLGKGFINKQDQNQIKFADFTHEAKNDFHTTPIYMFEEIGAHNIIEACKTLLGEKPDKEVANA